MELPGGAEWRGTAQKDSLPLPVQVIRLLYAQERLSS
jgi:hypothetical protein